MAIQIVGTSLHDMKRTAYESRDMHDVQVENNSNMIEIMLTNIKAAQYNGRTFISTFPNMTQIENDICGW